jgi:hypothetical protein
VRDDEGNLFQVPCRVGEGSDTIGKGETVMLVAYSAKQQIYQVIPGNAAAPSDAGAARGPGTTKAR